MVSFLFPDAPMYGILTYVYHKVKPHVLYKYYMDIPYAKRIWDTIRVLSQVLGPKPPTYHYPLVN